LDVLDVVNLRSMFDPHHPAEGSLEAPLNVLADLAASELTLSPQTLAELDGIAS
jgi:hypothetical protein